MTAGNAPNAWATYVNMTMTASIKNLGNKTVDKYGITLTSLTLPAQRPPK